MSFAELGKSFSKAIATSVVDEALKTPIREGADIVGQLFNLAASDRSPGALGRGKSFEIEKGIGMNKRTRPVIESYNHETEKFDRYKTLPQSVQKSINKKQQYGIGAGLGENIYEDMLTDTSKTYGKGLKTPAGTYEDAQERFMIGKGSRVKEGHLKELGVPQSAIDVYTKSGGTELPGYRGVPTIREDDFSLQVSREKSSENPLLNWAYKNPEAIGHGITYGAPIAGMAGAGLATYFATKPRSDYSVGIGPSTGNSNIDAARASAYYQQETAQMKFEHQMALQQMRQQAQTPGRQDYGKALGLGLPDTLGSGDARDAYNMATSIIGAQTPIYK